MSTATVTANPHAPDGSRHHALTLALAVPSVEQALDFYARAFGAREVYRAPSAGEHVIHAQLRLGDTLFFLGRAAPEDPHSFQAPASLSGTSCAVYLYVTDCSSAVQCAVAEGATALYPVTVRPWGDEEALLRDPFGHLWAVAARRSEASDT